MAIIVYAAISLVAYYVPSQFDIYDYQSLLAGSDGEGMVPRPYLLNVLCLVFFTFFQNLASLLLMVIWLDVIKTLARFVQTKRKRVKNKATKVLVLGFLYVVILLSLVLFDYGVDAYFLVSLFNISISIFYIVVAIKFNKTMNALQHQSNNPTVQDTIGFVRRVCRAKAVFLGVGSFLVVAFAFITSNEDYTLEIEPGTFYFAIFIRDLALLTSLSVLTITVWYANSSSEGPVIADIYPRLCWIFSCWDRKNRALLTDQIDSSVVTTKYVPNTSFVAGSSNTNNIPTEYSENRN